MGHASRTDRVVHRTAGLLAERERRQRGPALPSCGRAGEPTVRKARGWSRTSPRSGIADGKRRADHRGRPKLRGIVTAGSGGGRRCPPSAARVQLPAEVGRASPRSAARSPPRSRHRSEGGTLHRPPTPWPRRSSKTVSRGSSDRPPTDGSAEPWRPRQPVHRRPGSRWPRRTVCAQDQGTPPSCNASSPVVAGASWSSTPATTRPVPSRPRPRLGC